MSVLSEKLWICTECIMMHAPLQQEYLCKCKWIGILFVMIHELFKIALSFLMNNKPQAQIVVKMRLCSEITLHYSQAKITFIIEDLETWILHAGLWYILVYLKFIISSCCVEGVLLDVIFMHILQQHSFLLQFLPTKLSLLSSAMTTIYKIQHSHYASMLVLFMRFHKQAVPEVWVALFQQLHLVPSMTKVSPHDCCNWCIF